MIRWRIVERPEYDDIEVYGYFETADGRRPVWIADGRPQVAAETIRQGSVLPATLTISRLDWAPLLEAVRASGPVTSVEADALTDARGTRDRLLRLVESEWSHRHRT